MSPERLFHAARREAPPPALPQTFSIVLFFVVLVNLAVVGVDIVPAAGGGAAVILLRARLGAGALLRLLVPSM